MYLSLFPSCKKIVAGFIYFPKKYGKMEFPVTLVSRKFFDNSALAF